MQPNYELVYDNVSFAERYACLLEGIPLNKCGLPKEPKCDDDEKTAEPEETEEVSKERHVRYVYRNYLGIKIKLGPEICDDGVDNDLDGMTDGKFRMWR